MRSHDVKTQLKVVLCIGLSVPAWRDYKKLHIPPVIIST